MQTKLLHREALTRSKLLHRETFTHTANFFTQENLLHREDFTQSKLFHRASLCTEKLLDREAFTIFDTASFAQSTSHYYFVLPSLHKGRPSTTLYYKACTQHVPVLLCAAMLGKSMRNCNSKTGSRRQSGKTTILKHF